MGIGPGAYEKMTIEAADALRNCDVIIGYTVYVDLVKEHFAGKEFLTTPMRKEVERCVWHLKLRRGKTGCYDLQRRCRRLRYGRSDV